MHARKVLWRPNVRQNSCPLITSPHAMPLKPDRLPRPTRSGDTVAPYVLQVQNLSWCRMAGRYVYPIRNNAGHTFEALPWGARGVIVG